MTHFARTSLTVLALALLVSAPAIPHAQQAQAPSASRHVYVTEGLFDLKLGKSLDLTDRKVLLNLPYPHTYNTPQIIADRRQIYLRINGQEHSLQPGQRIDLKTLRYSNTPKIFQDMVECYLDLIDITSPKGGLPTAHFRFNCH